MDKNLESRIIGDNRHQFIYGYNTEKRKELLLQFVKNNPIVLSKKTPLVYLIDEFGLPNINTDKNLDNIRLTAIVREHLNFQIASSLVNYIENNDIPFSEYQFLILCKSLDIYAKVDDLKTLSEMLKESVEFYRSYYLAMFEGQQKNINIAIPFIDILMFIKAYKQVFDNPSHLCILFDYQQEISKLSQRAINSLINSRINGDMSIKVVCEPHEWLTYCDLNGVFIENIHDYGIEELDDSYKKYVKK